MKKNKRKLLIKSLRKTVRESIKQNLVSQLKEVAEKFGSANKKFEKGSKQWAKKLSKELKIKEVVLFETKIKAETEVPQPKVADHQSHHPAPVKTVSANQSKASKSKKEPAETAS